MHRGDLTNEEWQRLEPLLPPQKPKTGRPARDHRRVINGMLWIARTGAPWRDLPERYGPVGTVSSRFYRWRQAGIWHGILTALQQQADANGRLNWELHFVDGTSAGPSARGWGKKRDPETEALGRSRGGFSTKLHLRAEGGGKPLTFLVTAGQRHEAVVFERLMEQGAVARPGPGRPNLRPARVVGDKGYRSTRIRQYLQRRGIRMTIPRKVTERRSGRFDRAAYRQRNRIERLINRLKQYRRIATRYEKRAANYVAMLTIVAIRFWL